MKIHRQAFVYRLRERPRQAADFLRFAGCCRFAWNKALALQLRYRRRFGKHLGYARLAGRLPGWKRIHPFLSLAPSQALQQTLKDLDSAWSGFFLEPGRVGRPKFKSRRSKAAFRLPQGVTLDAANARIFLPKTGWVRLRLSRPVAGSIKNVTVSLRATGWRVAIQTEIQAEVLPRRGAVVGVDVGVASTATATDGTVLNLEARLAGRDARARYLQRCLSRKAKGSARHKLAKARLARHHDKTARIRQDALHKLTTGLVERHAVICVEDLKVAAMAAAGPGKKELNRRILGAAWSSMRFMLAYKAERSGGRLEAVDPAFTSQACAECGHVASENRKTQAKFKCVACGHADHADANAARNIRARGIENLSRAGSLACPEGHKWPAGSRLLDAEAAVRLAGPMKRQPSEGPRRKAA